MKKEIFLAVFIGLALGLAITFGVYQARRSVTTDPAPSPSLSPSPSPSASQSDLVVIAPENEAVVSNETTTVTGTAAPNAFVAIVTATQEELLSADAEGRFTREITLEPGANVILVETVDQDGARAETERTVIYLDEPLQTAAPSESDTESSATDSADADTDATDTTEDDSTEE